MPDTKKGLLGCFCINVELFVEFMLIALVAAKQDMGAKRSSRSSAEYSGLKIIAESGAVDQQAWFIAQNHI